MPIALILLSPLILTILSFFTISIIETVREGRRRIRPPGDGELPKSLEELLRRRQ